SPTAADCGSRTRARAKPSGRRWSPSLVVHHQGADAVGLEAASPTERSEFDGEPEPGHLATDHLDELGAGERCATRREQVINDVGSGAGRERVFVDVEAVLAVLERVLDGHASRGEFARLS